MSRTARRSVNWRWRRSGRRIRSNTPSSGNRSPPSRANPMGATFRRAVIAAPRVFLGLLVLGAIGAMLFGVFARYVLLPITDWLDTDPVNFFWVEEVGETALAWITMIGAAIAVA